MLKHLPLAASVLLLCAAQHRASAQLNYALEFNGSTSRVNIGDEAGSNLRTIEFWFRGTGAITPSSAGNGRSLIIRDDGGQTNEFGMYIRGTDWPTGLGYLYFFMRDNGALHEISSNNNTWSANTWYHVCGTIDPLTGMKLYIDGVLQGQGDPTGTVAVPGATEDAYFGRWGALSIRYHYGRMDEVRFWNRALSQAEIQARMCYWLTPANEIGLVGYWRMNEGSGTTLYDVTASANNGVITSAPYVQDDGCFNGYIAVEEIATQLRTTVQPNPCVTGATLHVDGLLNDATVQITNGLGQVVRTLAHVYGGSVAIQRGHLAVGIYRIAVLENNAVVSTAQLMVADR